LPQGEDKPRPGASEYNNEDDFCMVIRTNQKLLLSENKKVSILVDKEMGLEAAIFRGPRNRALVNF